MKNELLSSSSGSGSMPIKDDNNGSKSISVKGFNKYKQLRKRFGARYQHQANKTMDNILCGAFNKKDKDDDENKLDPLKYCDETDDDTDDNGTGTDTDDIHTDSDIDEDDGDDDDNGDDNGEHNDTTLKPQRSAAKSRIKIAGYHGNQDLKQLFKLYKKQHKIQKLHQTQSCLSLAPAKPSNISDYIDNSTKCIYSELKLRICNNTRYNGLAGFVLKNGELSSLSIEIEFISNIDNNGYISGKRIISFKFNKYISGCGRLWYDLIWNGYKYLPAVRFEYSDINSDGIITKFEFNSVLNTIDINNSFFVGICSRSKSSGSNSNNDNNIMHMHRGYFDFICVSARRRTILTNNNAMCLYHKFDINNMNENELKKVPKYIKRMNIYTDKINKLL